MANLKTPEEAQSLRCCGPEGCGRKIDAEKAQQHPKLWRHGDGRYCIGPECMGWRIFASLIHDGTPRTVVHDGMAGFCGLAGEPE